jgi:hypothetical protein
VVELPRLGIRLDATSATLVRPGLADRHGGVASANTSKASMPAVFLHSSRYAWQRLATEVQGEQARKSMAQVLVRIPTTLSCYSHVYPLARTPPSRNTPGNSGEPTTPIGLQHTGEALRQRFKWPSCLWPLAV